MYERCYIIKVIINNTMPCMRLPNHLTQTVSVLLWPGHTDISKRTYTMLYLTHLF